MYLHVLIYTVLLNIVISEALFFWKEKPIFFCFKVCPLYCSKREKRRVDEDLPIYYEEPPTFESEFWVEDFPFPPPYYYGHWVHKMTKKPKPMTTSEPTTTTEPTTTSEPTYICIVCEKKCGYTGQPVY